MHKYDNNRPFPLDIVDCCPSLHRPNPPPALPLVAIEELPVPDIPEKSPGMETKLSEKRNVAVFGLC